MNVMNELKTHVNKYGKIVIRYNDEWRICTKCWEYKLWDEFANSKTWFMGHTWKCKECRNRIHQEYRERTNRARDRQYKIEKRHLEIWDQIYFNSEIWEVKEKRYNWYIVKSIMNWTERRISTSDNHYRRNNNCVRFTKLKNSIVMMVSKQKPKFSVEADEELYELI